MRCAKLGAATGSAVIVLLALALCGSTACSSFLFLRTCYRENVVADRLQGTVAVSSPCLNVAGPVADDAPPLGNTPPGLHVSLGVTDPGNEVGLPFGQPQIGLGIQGYTLSLAAPASPGTYTLESLGACASSPGAPATGATAGCDGGSAAGPAPDAGGDAAARVECLPVAGVLVVQTNTARDCRSDNSNVEGQPQSEVCHVLFDAQLTLGFSDHDVTIAGSFSIHFEETIASYDCSSLND
jgi:hypothetical protein